VRLGRLVHELGLTGFRQYCEYLLADRTGAAVAALADRLTTNHTSFFREPAHFDFLCDTVLPRLNARPRIDIWSAGCSSGEEPFSIAISLLEAAPHAASRVRIHATDISTRMLQRASAAVYHPDRVASIPSVLRSRYFAQAGESGMLRVAHHVRALVDFAYFNLMEPFPPCRYSAIFCRNVMLYFVRSTTQSLIRRFVEQLEPGGFLFIGHSESLSGMEHSLETVTPSIYRKPGQSGRSYFATAPPKHRTALTPFSVAPEEVSA